MHLFCVMERILSEELGIFGIFHLLGFFFPFWLSEVNLAAMWATVFN